MSAGPRRDRALGYALVAIAASSWGTWPLVLRRARVAPALSAAVVMAAITLVALPFMARDRVAAKARPSQWAGVAWLGVADAANIALFFAAYRRTTVAIAVLTHYLTPILVALAAPFALRERANARTFGAVAVATLGLVLLLEPWRAGIGRDDVVGALLGAGSAVFYASNVLVNKRLVPVFSGSELMFFHGLVGTPLLFALVPREAYAIDARSAALLGAGALGPGALAGLFFVWGLRRVPAGHASVLTLLEPFVAVLLAGLILGEALSVVPILGGLLILAGAAVVVTASQPGAAAASCHASNAVQSTRTELASPGGEPDGLTRDTNR